MTESNKWTCLIRNLNDIFSDLSCTTNNTYSGGHPYARANFINDLKLYSNESSFHVPLHFAISKDILLLAPPRPSKLK